MTEHTTLQVLDKRRSETYKILDTLLNTVVLKAKLTFMDRGVKATDEDIRTLVPLLADAVHASAIHRHKSKTTIEAMIHHLDAAVTPIIEERIALHKPQN